MTISFLDIKKQNISIQKKILKSIKNNINNSSFIGGFDLEKFQKEFSKYLKVKYCIGTANGTDALEISLKALELKKDSEVIVPANTWISTAEAVLNNGLKVKFVDVDHTHNICIKDLKKKINNNTKAIMIVHLYGNPANIPEIIKLCKKNNIKIIEDCAQSHGAEFKGRKVSTFGDLGTFSFFPSKNLGCYGDGGCIVTNNKKYFLKCKKIANHGGLKKNSHETLGRNSRLDNLQAGILRIKLRKLDSWINLRNKQAEIYTNSLSKIRSLSFVKKLKNTKSSFHLFVIKTQQRDKLREFLKSKKINTGIHYPLSLPETPIFKKHMSYCKDMNSKKFSREILSLPIGEHLKLKDVKKISKTIKQFFNE